MCSYNLAYIYDDNWDLLGMDKVDALTQAKELYVHAAKEGNVLSKNNLGLLLRNNWECLGLDQLMCLNEAIRYFEDAAFSEPSLKLALYNLGHTYQYYWMDLGLDQEVAMAKARECFLAVLN